MLDDDINEARRQIEICNACRYCEGFCSVFPAIHEKREFELTDITHLANLCHNCRGCYYACQFTEPHEFAMNLPKILAEIRHESWKDYAWPQVFSKVFDRSGIAIMLGLFVGVFFFFILANKLAPNNGNGFYGIISHETMMAIFIPAFIFPLFAIVVSLKNYIQDMKISNYGPRAIWGALLSVASMKDLSGGHGDGCNYEDEDRYSNWRRYFHQATMYGFLLCFASTSSGTVLHYFFDMPAPYGFFSLPKAFGLSGGVLLSAGTIGLAGLKLKADKNLGAPKIWGGEMAFVLLLFFVSTTGLLLYAATGTPLVEWLLPIHLSTVLVFFILTPYSKMMHGFYRLLALLCHRLR